ncbi:MAG: hypothetical protein OER87_06975 [Gammaproteobacteria bacterium]|nr:hypothetical protein [Gammaproteobacteria bacterium]
MRNDLISRFASRVADCFRPSWFVLFLTCGCYANHALALDLGPDFDHDETNFPLDYKHALADCESCHVQGIFIGTPRRCVDCHSNSGRIKASAPSSRHIRVVGDCDYCHTSDSWTTVVRVDHSVVIGSCINCHNGVAAEGKNPGHIPSGNFCDDCHTTYSWKFYHVNVVNNCVFCHNGSIATGKNPGHIQSTSTCEDCHRTSSWAPVLRVDHGSVLGTCFSCHNNVIARGKGPLHVPSSNDCSVCHSVTGWVPAF